jgi:MFS family permease
LVSIFGGMLSYLGFAFASHLWVLFIARAFAGLFGANISTAMAYIADVTEEKNRSKGMGLIGAAFGLGFVLGPFLGAESGHFGTTLGSTPPLGIQFSAILASALCLVNFIFAFFYLKESLQPEDRRQARRSGRLALLKLHITRPVVGQLMVIFLLSGLSMAHMESTLFLWVKDEWGWGLRLAGLGFAYVGVMIAFTQGYLIRRLMPKLGEKKLMTLGLALLGLGFWGVNLSSSVWILGVTMTLIALGNGLGNPAILGSVSLLTPKEQQGETMGVTHSLSALARIIGPALGGWFYGHYSHGMPFWVAGGLTFLALIMVLKLYSRLPEKGLESSLSQSSVRD